MFNDYWDQVFYINRDARADRRERIEFEFDKMKIQAERFRAVEPTTSHPKLTPERLGCKLSHLFAVRAAKARNAKSLFIFEDDCRFAVGFQALFESFMQSLPEWDMVILGCNPKTPIKHATKYAYTTDVFWCTHAYGIKGYAFDVINNIRVMSAPEPLDICYNRYVYPELRVFVCNPHIAYQADGYSDIECAYVENSRWTQSPKR